MGKRGNPTLTLGAKWAFALTDRPGQPLDLPGKFVAAVGRGADHRKAAVEASGTARPSPHRQSAAKQVATHAVAVMDNEPNRGDYDQGVDAIPLLSPFAHILYPARYPFEQRPDFLQPLQIIAPLRLGIRSGYSAA